SQNDPEITRHHAAKVGATGFIGKADLAKDLTRTIEDALGKNERSRNDEKLWLSGGGTLGKLIREHDWSKTPLGPIVNWPLSLQISVNLMLNSQHPMWIGWGREMTFLYNDAYISVLSLAKHPRCLGLPAREVWPEIWDTVGSLAEKVFSK